MSRLIPVWAGTVGADGKLRLDSRSLFDRYLTTLRNTPIQMVVKKLGRPKSHSQLGYLWGVVYPVIAEDFGYMDYELDALHDSVMRELRGLKPDPNPLGLRVSLAEMDHEAVKDYITDVRHWALTKYSIVTPDAEKVEFKESRKRTRAA